MILKNKIILVTGGEGLLGRAMVEDIREQGGIAISCDVAKGTNLDDHELYCDITDSSSIGKALDAVMNHYGRLDGLVNNAYPRTKDWGVDFEDMSEDNLATNVSWQLNSYILFCQLAIKKCKVRSIVNITSIYGMVGNDFSVYEGLGMNPPAPYTAIKGGLINFSRYLASRYGAEGIRVNCISPGGIFDYQPKEFVRRYEHKVPMKRMGNPDDIAPAVSFLLSERAKYITGQNLTVDGGWTSI